VIDIEVNMNNVKLDNLSEVDKNLRDIPFEIKKGRVFTYLRDFDKKGNLILVSDKK
jgi:hypothetical protein